MDVEKILLIYADGSCNHRRQGGWSVYCKNFNYVRVGTDSNTTNNRMELMGMCAAIDYILEGIYTKAIIRSDSSYVINGINKWLEKWYTYNFAEVKNPDLWMMIYHRIKRIQKEGREVEFVWVKGHASDPGNIRADEEAVKARKKQFGK